MESQRKANPKQVENIDSTLITASILVAEDNLVNQILIKKFLKKWHIGKIVIASDGQEALEEFEKSEKPFTPEDLYIKIAAYLSPKDRN